MDLARVRKEIALAQQYFSYLDAHATPDGKLFALCAMQSSIGQGLYTLAVSFPDSYPSTMPTVTVRKPALHDSAPHRYKAGNICYLHQSMWNPGQHTLLTVLQRAAKWISKYEVWMKTGNWPGAEIKH
jgi:ubiquitin-protein ligase